MAPDQLFFPDVPVWMPWMVLLPLTKILLPSSLLGWLWRMYFFIKLRFALTRENMIIFLSPYNNSTWKFSKKQRVSPQASVTDLMKVFLLIAQDLKSKESDSISVHCLLSLWIWNNHKRLSAKPHACLEQWFSICGSQLLWGSHIWYP